MSAFVHPRSPPGSGSRGRGGYRSFTHCRGQSYGRLTITPRLLRLKPKTRGNKQQVRVHSTPRKRGGESNHFRQSATTDSSGPAGHWRAGRQRRHIPFLALGLSFPGSNKASSTRRSPAWAPLSLRERNEWREQLVSRIVGCPSSCCHEGTLISEHLRHKAPQPEDWHLGRHLGSLGKHLERHEHQQGTHSCPAG